MTQNVISTIDGAYRRCHRNAEVVFCTEGQDVLACPTWHGGKDCESVSESTETPVDPVFVGDSTNQNTAETVRNGLSPSEKAGSSPTGSAGRTRGRAAAALVAARESQEPPRSAPTVRRPSHLAGDSSEAALP